MNAHTKSVRGRIPVAKTDMITLRDDGALVVTPEQLARFGNGDVNQGRRELKLLIALEQDRDAAPDAKVSRPASVRIAGPVDEKNVLDLLLIDIKENADRVAPLDEGRILDMIQLGTHQRGGIVGVIDGADGKPVAVSVLCPMQWWWSRGWYIQEMVNFVHPDHRQSRHIHDLIAFEMWVSDAWSKNAGYRVHLMCGVLGVRRIREKTAMYRRKLRQHGAVFLYPSALEDTA